MIKQIYSDLEIDRIKAENQINYATKNRSFMHTFQATLGAGLTVTEILNINPNEVLIIDQIKVVATGQAEFLIRDNLDDFTFWFGETPIDTASIVSVLGTPSVELRTPQVVRSNSQIQCQVTDLSVAPNLVLITIVGLRLRKI